MNMFHAEAGQVRVIAQEKCSSLPERAQIAG